MGELWPPKGDCHPMHGIGAILNGEECSGSFLQRGYMDDFFVISNHGGDRAQRHPGNSAYQENRGHEHDACQGGQNGPYGPQASFLARAAGANTGPDSQPYRYKALRRHLLESTQAFNPPAEPGQVLLEFTTGSAVFKMSANPRRAPTAQLTSCQQADGSISTTF